jgi:hypothetical protein
MISKLKKPFFFFYKNNNSSSSKAGCQNLKTFLFSESETGKTIILSAQVNLGA